MKRFLKIGLLGIVSFLAFSIPRADIASAADTTSYTVTDSDYTVTIPTEVEIDSTSKSQTMHISGSLLQTNKLTISVSSANSNKLVYEDDSISYTMDKSSFYHASTNAVSPTVDFTDDLTLTVNENASPRYAESYSDQLTFSFSSESINYFDLNGDLDGNDRGDIDGIGSADIYINGQLVSSGATDCWAVYPYGTSYEVKNIKTNDGYTYIGKESYSGTITDKWQRVDLPFVTNYTLTLNPHGGTVSISSLSIGQSLNYYDQLPTPTREGYTFAGWYTAEQGVRGSTLITADNAIMEAYNSTLYAHWTKNDSGENSYYFDINSYSLDDQLHHESLSDYGSATVKINGSEADVDYQLFDEGTTFEITNVTANDPTKYEYVGYYITYMPVREGEELTLREGDLQTDTTISLTLNRYTSIYFVFKEVITDTDTDTNTGDTSGSTDTNDADTSNINTDKNHTSESGNST